MGLCGHFSFILSLRETVRRNSGVFIKSLVHRSKNVRQLFFQHFPLSAKKGLNGEFPADVSELEGSFVAGDNIKA
jgi:hypothetical protein